MTSVVLTLGSGEPSGSLEVPRAAEFEVWREERRGEAIKGRLGSRALVQPKTRVRTGMGGGKEPEQRGRQTERKTLNLLLSSQHF